MATSDDPFNSFLSAAVAASGNKAEPDASANIPISAYTDGFWYQPPIDGMRWNKLYPYKLSIVKVTKASDGNPSWAEVPAWGFTLPIPPKSLTITTNPAVSVEATLGGIHEQSNGVVFKMINLRGSTGVLPLKGSGASAQPLSAISGLTQSIFGGTVEAIGRTANSGLALANVRPTQQLVPDSTFQDLNSAINLTSGYYQFKLLEKFLQNYLNLTKTRVGADYRLALCCFKDERVYLVTPVPWTLERSSNSPYEYNYNLSFKAWRQIKLGVDVQAANDYRPAMQTAGGIGSIMKAVLDARDILSNARDAISNIGKDVDAAFFEPLRQLALFAKDLTGVPLACADLPRSIISSAKSLIITWVATQQSLDGTRTQFRDSDHRLSEAWDDIVALANSTGAPTIKNGQIQFNSSILTSGFAVDKANDPFEHPEDNYDFFNSIQPTQISLTPTIAKQIAEERNKVRAFTRDDFETMRDNFVQVLTDFECSVGGGDNTYISTFNTHQVNNPNKTPSDDDFEIIYQMNRVIIQLGKLAATKNVNQYRVDGLAYVAGLAAASGIAFTTPVSKYAVPFPYDSTLEDLAERYLGDPDRWMEISQLNGLRAPYVDEVGFSKPFLADGSENAVTLADSVNLVLGQVVWIQSNTKNSSQRRITKIEDYSGFSLITLDGDPDLTGYRYLAGAYLHAFLPDTVNSQQIIYIPSQAPLAEADYGTKDIPGLDDFDPLIAAGGVSLLLDNNNDLIVTPDGGTKWSVGLTNIIQNTRIRLGIPQGSLNRHPNVGLPIKVGQSLADLSASQLAAAIRNLYADTPGYAGAQSILVQVAGPVAKISYDLKIPGLSSNVPVSFETRLG